MQMKLQNSFISRILLSNQIFNFTKFSIKWSSWIWFDEIFRQIKCNAQSTYTIYMHVLETFYFLFWNSTSKHKSIHTFVLKYKKNVSLCCAKLSHLIFFRNWYKKGVDNRVDIRPNIRWKWPNIRYSAETNFSCFGRTLLEWEKN